MYLDTLDAIIFVGASIFGAYWALNKNVVISQQQVIVHTAAQEEVHSNVSLRHLNDFRESWRI